MPRQRNHVKNIIRNLSITLLILLFTFFMGINFDKIRILLTGDEDTIIYRDICEAVNPLFKIGFDNGNFKFSVLEEINTLIFSLFQVNFKYPITIIDAEMSLFNSYSSLIELDKDKLNNEGYAQDVERAKFKTSESSVEFQSDHEDEDSWSEKSGSILFTKECNVKFDANELLAKPFNIDFNKKGPKVLIYHTHTSESYLPSSRTTKIVNKGGESSEHGVVRIGEELANRLKKDYAIEVIHNATVNDRPDSRYSYGNALGTVTNILKSYPSIKVVIDLHRDGISDTEKFRPVVSVAGKKVAKVMMVLGTNYTGLEHPNWKTNLTMALHIQKKLEEVSPGITRPIYISKYRYNQQVTNYALIMEVGGDGNTISESLESTKYLAQAISAVVKK